jgi:hypothetical protein
MLLTAFFDETASSPQLRIRGVAGQIFDNDGLIAFTEAWSRIVAEYRDDFSLDLRPMHATDCCGHYARKHFEGWMHELRTRACVELARICAQTRIGGAVSTVEDFDYAAFEAQYPRAAAEGGSPYTAATMACMGLAAKFLSKAEDEIVFVLETGGPHHDEVDRLLRKVANSDDLRRKYRYSTHAFVPKGDPRHTALISADILAWAVQEHYVRDDEAERAGIPEEPSTILRTLTAAPERPVFYYPMGPQRLALARMLRAVDGLLDL